MAYKVKAAPHTCFTDSHMQIARAVFFFFKSAASAYLLVHKVDVAQAWVHRAGCECDREAYTKGVSNLDLINFFYIYIVLLKIGQISIPCLFVY